MGERWKPLPGHTRRYEVSSWGNVRSVGTRRLRMLRKNARGEIVVRIYGSAGGAPKPVAELVARAFLGARRGRQVVHKNGDVADNRVENLAYKAKAKKPPGQRPNTVRR